MDRRALLMAAPALALAGCAPARSAPVTGAVARLLGNAHEQTRHLVLYDSGYTKIAYPDGDVAPDKGVCADVVIRAYRGIGIDLQRLVHEDMRAHFELYPKKWGLKAPDSNIDHRRVPNLMTFFRKYGQSLPLETSGAALKSWQPGDIVCWKLGGKLWHIGVVSDGIGASGKPLVIHNALRCIEQDYLDNWPILGHFRYRTQQ